MEDVGLKEITDENGVPLEGSSVSHALPWKAAVLGNKKDL
jgi:hypothetical protein